MALAHEERIATRAVMEFSNRQKRRFLAQGFQVGAREAFGPAGELDDVDVRPDRHLPATEPDDRRAVGRIGFRAANNIVEPSASQERGLHAFGSIGGRQQNHAFHVAQVIDLTQQLAEDPLIDVRAGMIGAQPSDAKVVGLFSMKNSRVALGSTSFTPARKSSRVTCSAPRSADSSSGMSGFPAGSRAAARNRRRVIIPTSWHNASRSAPTKPWECSAIS